MTSMRRAAFVDTSFKPARLAPTSGSRDRTIPRAAIRRVEGSYLPQGNLEVKGALQARLIHQRFI